MYLIIKYFQSPIVTNCITLCIFLINCDKFLTIIYIFEFIFDVSLKSIIFNENYPHL